MPRVGSIAARANGSARRRSRDGDLFQRQHRHAQGRDAVAPQHLSNIEAIGAGFAFTPQDRIIGVLPFFHSFGFTGRSGCRCLTGFGAVYHSNPTGRQDDRRDWCRNTAATMLITTPTFCVSYLRRCTKEQFASLRYVIVGAEKLREPIAKAFREKFGVAILEGYGCTEMAPVVAVNVPDIDDGKETQIGHKPGTVGHPLPGVAAKVVDPEADEPLPPGRTDCCWSRAPTVMLGYLEPAGADRRGHARRLVHHRRHRHHRRGRLHLRSPTGCRASARSAARWCRI